MNSNELGEGLWNTVRDSAALDLVADVEEIGLDNLMDGPLKEVPVIGTAIKFWRAGAQLGDLVFLSKLTRFLRCVREEGGGISSPFVERMESDAKFRSRVGSNLVIAIERLDDVEKTDLLAHAFSLLAANRIDYEMFTEFVLAIDRCLITDLEWLEDTESRVQMPPSIATRLSACGLLEIEGIPTIRDKDTDNNYRMTSLGRELYTLVLNPGHKRGL